MSQGWIIEVSKGVDLAEFLLDPKTYAKNGPLSHLTPREKVECQDEGFRWWVEEHSPIGLEEVTEVPTNISRPRKRTRGRSTRTPPKDSHMMRRVNCLEL